LKEIWSSKGWLRAKLKNLKIKDQDAKGVEIQRMKFIKSGVNLEQFESLMRNMGQIE
jgi:hypothetical protein